MLTTSNQNSRSQNQEDLFVLNYFGDYKGTVLEIGANDGSTFSNSRLLIENGWEADLVEPGHEACKQLTFMYLGDSKKVRIYDFGIGTKNKKVDFWESDAHVKNGDDVGLVSTTNFKETKRWPDVKFTKRQIILQTFAKFSKDIQHFHPNRGPIKFDFISIDCEGSEWHILQQINLEEVGCKVLCIEWNSNHELLKLFTDYCKGYNLAIKNPENLIFVKELVKEELPKTTIDISNFKIGVGVTSNDRNKWIAPAQVTPKKYNSSYLFNEDQSTIARDKNKLIKQLYEDGCDYFFIFDDDTFPIKEGWEQFFIEASIRTGCQHFILGNDAHLNKSGGENGLTYFQKGTGCMLFLTRKVIEEVGYLNNKYGKYGYEHAAYSARIHSAGLTPSWYTSVDGWEEYIYSWDLQKEYAEKHSFVKVQQFTEQEKTAFIAENEFQYRKERRSRKIYYDYEQVEVVSKKKVAYISLSDDGSSYYRIQGVLPFIKNELLEITDISGQNWANWATLSGYDVLIMHRPFEQLHADVIELALSMGIWVISDYDDDVLNVPDHHPSFDLYKENKSSIINCVKKSDELWVSTLGILETLYNFNHNVHVVVNAHNDYLFPVEYKKKFKAENKRVTYRGGNTHRLDLFHVTDSLVKTSEENKDWEFIYIGIIDNQEFFDANRKNEKVFLTSKMPIVQYLTHLYALNSPVMICPLDDHKLNRSKSNICWLEGTYAGSAFFGNKRLPEFNLPSIFPFSLFPKAIKEQHIATMKKAHDESWEYIKENLLLSKINLKRGERLLA